MIDLKTIPVSILEILAAGKPLRMQEIKDDFIRIHGYALRGQTLRNAFMALLAEGKVERIHRGVYAIAGWRCQPLEAWLKDRFSRSLTGFFTADGLQREHAALHPSEVSQEEMRFKLDSLVKDGFLTEFDGQYRFNAETDIFS